MLGICTVIYNKLDFVKRTIEAVLENTKEPYKYILVYNNSPYEGVKEYIESLDIPKIINTENRGVTQAYLQGFNMLISQNELDYLCKIDDDTIIQTKDWNEKMLLAFEKQSVQSDFKLGILSANIDKGKQGGIYKEIKRDDFTFEIFNSPSVGGACTIYSVELFNQIGFFNDFGFYGNEDGEFAQRARIAGYQTAYLKEVYCKHLGRTEESDKNYDNWKLLYWNRQTDKDYSTWKKEVLKCQEIGKNTT